MLTPGPLFDRTFSSQVFKFFKSKGRRRRNEDVRIYFKQSNRCSNALKCQKWAIKKIDTKILMLTPGPLFDRTFSIGFSSFFKSKGRRRPLKAESSLRDGIRRFAPNKKTPREKASNADSVTSTSPSPVAVVVVRLPTNSNNFVDRKVEPSTSFDEFRQALCLPTQAVLEGVGRHSNRRIFTAEI